MQGTSRQCGGSRGLESEHFCTTPLVHGECSPSKMAAPRGKYRDIPCFYFNTPQGCWFGEFCHYRHEKFERTTLCRFYGTSRGCRFGDRCAYSHDLSMSESSGCGTSYSDLTTDETYYYMSATTDSACEPSTAGVSPDAAGAVSKGSGDLLSPLDLPTPEKMDLVTALEGLELTSTPNKAEGQEEEEEEDDSDTQWESDTDEEDEGEPCCPCSNRGKCCSCVCAKNGCTNCGNRNCRFRRHKERRQSQRMRRGSDRKKPLIYKCGRCPQIINRRTLNKSFRDHYASQFLSLNPGHLSYFREEPQFEDNAFWCGACTKTYSNFKDYMRHMKSKLESDRPADKEMHTKILDIIVRPFVEYDLGEIDEDDMRCRLMLMLLSCYVYEDDTTSHFLRRLRKVNKLRGSRLHHERERREVNFDDFFLACQVFGQLDDSDDSDLGYMGMSKDDEYELLCQGIKPWDPEAGAALAVLNGGYDEYGF